MTNLTNLVGNHFIRFELTILDNQKSNFRK